MDRLTESLHCNISDISYLTLTKDALCGSSAPRGWSKDVGEAGLWAEPTTAAAASRRRSLKPGGEGPFL